MNEGLAWCGLSVAGLDLGSWILYLDRRFHESAAIPCRRPPPWTSAPPCRVWIMNRNGWRIWFDDDDGGGGGVSGSGSGGLLVVVMVYFYVEEKVFCVLLSRPVCSGHEPTSQIGGRGFVLP